jgi:predicted unusual protein kinase regulating ubiquinone biosynthesis (AarF/ABC1/UbiB family)
MKNTSEYFRRIKLQSDKAVKISKLAVNIGIAKGIQKKDNKYIGKLACDNLNKLGPTFVKIGQFISTRSDIFGREFTDELKVLQDKVVPMSAADISGLITSVKSVYGSDFEVINEEPLASASIGQVHYAKLRDGREAVIKFKRRNIASTIKDDFDMLLGIVNFIKMFSQHRQIQEVEISLKEYYALLKDEIDFVKEVQNMKTFAEQFKSTKWIKVPVPYETYCNNDMIVMEYVPSIKIDDLQAINAAGLKMEVISQKLLECFFTQIVQYGFVHIDPHPGNVGILKQGKIVFYDYGMFVKLSGIMKDNIKLLFLAMYDRDVEDVCDLLIEYEIILVEPAKKPYFKKFIASFLGYLDNLDIDNFKISYLDRIDQSEMQFLISSKFILLLRGISILEGVCKNLNPNFNYREILDPFISEFILDISYLERRGTKDLANFSKASDRISTSEISIGMVENDIEMIKKKLAAMTSSYDKQRVVFSLISMLAFTNIEDTQTRFILLLAFLYVIINK